MKNYTYYFVDGTTSTVEVEDELYDELTYLDKKERSNNRSNTRRHISLESLMQMNKEPSVLDEYFVGGMFGDISDEKLRRALSELTERQKELLYDVVIARIPQTEIAERDNMTLTAVNNRFRRIIKKLQTYFSENVDF